MTRVRRSGFALVPVLVTVLAAAGSAGVGAQQVFRIVGPDGRVTFSDKPPTDGQGRGTPAPTVVMPGGNAAAPSGAALPFELRSIASRYPVTLYTGQDCGPCQSGRSFLSSRGIPFNERTITTEDDVEALTRLAGQPRLPLLTIGGQQLRGFSEVEWAQFLDAAGYPRTSQLPSGYRNPPAAPLVAATQAPRGPTQAAAPQPANNAAPTAAQPAEPEAPPNPAGIRF